MTTSEVPQMFHTTVCTGTEPRLTKKLDNDTTCSALAPTTLITTACSLRAALMPTSCMLVAEAKSLACTLKVCRQRDREVCVCVRACAAVCRG